MKSFWLSIGLFLALIMQGKAQVLIGQITDEEGRAIEGATIYIRETMQGTVADENGNFRIHLAAGDYSLEISALGYEKQLIEWEITEKEASLSVRLKPIRYMLKEVRVIGKGEDPAYYIMRNAIARAPYHRRKVKEYFSEVYSRGNCRIDNLPRILKWGKTGREVFDTIKGKTLLMESVMDIKFQSPNRYKRNILAFSTTIPEEIGPENALNVVTSSIYDPDILGILSPLSPGAFSSYKFRLEDSYREGERMINKIEVQSKIKNNRLWNGWIYIADEEWCVVGFDFSYNVKGFSAQMQVGFNEITAAIFLPTSYNITIGMDMMGLEGEAKYFSSVKYKELQIDTIQLTLATEDTSIRKRAVSKKEQKIRHKIQELSEKEDLTNRQAYELARLSQRLQEWPSSDSVSPYQIPLRRLRDSVTADTMVTKRDSLYWQKIRTVPLLEEEIKSYEGRDSLRKFMEKVFGPPDTVPNKADMIFSKIMLGDTFALDNRKRVGLEVGGLWEIFPQYNVVDGLWIGQNVQLHIYMNKGKKISFGPSLYYGTARKTLLWKMNANWLYAPMSRGQWELDFGEMSEDYGHAGEGALFENSISSFFFQKLRKNFIRFYERRFIHLKHSIDIANGLTFAVEGQYERRDLLRNHISRKNIEPNDPVLEGGVDMPENTSLIAGIRLTYTPCYFFTVKNHQKQYERSAWPTFSIGYVRGLPTDATYTSRFERLDIGVKQNIKLGLFDSFSYSVNAGQFLSRKEIYFPDYMHFTTIGWVYSTDRFSEDFFLGEYYAWHTKDKWLRGAINYNSAFLLLKRLPFMQNMTFDEGIHGRYLWTPEIGNYMECGYSIGLQEYSRLGVFVGFNRHGYQEIKVRMALPLQVKEFKKIFQEYTK